MKLDPYIEAYAKFLASKSEIGEPLRVVCDYSNGPASLVMKKLARKLSAQLDIVHLNDEIDPEFSAHGPDPSAPEALAEAGKKVVESRADLGVIFDGDGDRAVFLDERGVPVPPAVVALCLMASTDGAHVVDVLLYEALTHLDPSLKGRIFPSKVGRYFISREMKEKGAVLGAELSGHFFFKDFFGLDSAVLNAIYVLNALSRAGEPASRMFSRYGGHTVIAAKARLKDSFESAARGVRSALTPRQPKVSETDGLTFDFGDSWVNMRASNTEPVVRITAGAGDPNKAQALANELVSAVS